MGIMSESAKATYDGHDIEVEAKVTNVLGTGQYSLFIDSERVDETEGTHGTFTLRGKLPAAAEGNDAKQVVVRVEQRLTSTGYTLEVDGQDLVMTTA